MFGGAAGQAGLLLGLGGGALGGVGLGAKGALLLLGLEPGGLFGALGLGAGGVGLGVGGLAGAAIGLFGGGQPGCRGGRVQGRGVEIALQAGEAVALLQPHRRCRGGAGLDRIAVPAPHGTFPADQHLAGRQRSLERSTFLHQPDLRQRAGEGGGSLDQGIESLRASRQGGHPGQHRQGAPMPGSTLVCGGIQFFAECGTQGGFEPRRNLQLVDHARPFLAVAHAEHLSQSGGLGGQTGACRTGGGGSGAGIGQLGLGGMAQLVGGFQGSGAGAGSITQRGVPGLANALQALGAGFCRVFQGGRAGLLGGAKGGLRRLDTGGGSVLRLLRLFQPGGIDAQASQPGGFPVQSGPLLVQPAGALFGLRQAVGQRAVPGGQFGGVFGGAVCLGLGHADGVLGLGGMGFGSGQFRRVGGVFLGEAGFLERQSCDSGSGVALLVAGMGQVTLDGGEPAGGTLQGLAGAGFLGGQLFAGDAVALQPGAGLALA